MLMRVVRLSMALRAACIRLLTAFLRVSCAWRDPGARVYARERILECKSQMVCAVPAGARAKVFLLNIVWACRFRQHRRLGA